jgi:hypothetical protein
MTHSVRTLLLAAVVFMASQANPPTAGGEGQGPGLQVTCFVCVYYTQAGQLSSRCLFLSRSAVNRHIAQAKPCRNAAMVYREMPIQILAVDVMAGGWGRAGPAPSMRHQKPGGTRKSGVYTQTFEMDHITTKMLKHKIENYRSNSTWKINFPTKKSGVRHLS